MKKLDTSSISPAAQFPVKSGTLDFLQQSYAEALNALAQSILGPILAAVAYNSNAVYVLFGCVNSTALPACNTSAGAVYYNGEVFLIPAASFFVAGGQVIIGNINTTFYMTNADPVLFTDNVQRNVHQIRTIQLTSGVAGSGNGAGGAGTLPDFSTWIVANPQCNVSGPLVSGTYPNFIIANPPNRILAVGNTNIGDISNSGTYRTIPIGVTLSTAAYKIGWAFISQGANPFIDTTVSPPTFKNKTTVSFDAQFAETQPQVQNISLDWYLISNT